MRELSNSESSQIELCIQQAISDRQLQMELIDHCCCSVSDKVNSGISFHDALKQSLRELAPEGIQQIEKEVQFVLKPNTSFTMKISMYFFGFIAATFELLGLTFKLLHWPGGTRLLFLAAIAMIISMISVLLSVRTRRHHLTRQRKIRSISGSVGVLIFASGAIFKMMHWPGANIQLLLSTLIIAGLFMPLLFWEMYKSESNKFSQAA